MKPTKPKKLTVAFIFGGKSAEHEVSLRSAKNVIDAIDKNKFNKVLIGIDKQGSWHRVGEDFLLNSDNNRNTRLNQQKNKQNGLVTIVSENNLPQLVELDSEKNQQIDVVFPILHGTFGEDGTIQGLLKLAGIPFVGPSVLGSAVGMDKDVMKRLFVQAGLPTAKFVVLQRGEKASFVKIKKQLGLPMFVKPANAGSSVGVSKVKNEKEFSKALKAAFEFDNKILVEEFIKCREIECAVLGNEKPHASIPGEVLPTHEFYSYEAKYLDENGAAIEIPAKLSKKQIKEFQDLAIKAFKTLCLEGMSRVDFFLHDDGKIFINEVNTIPGFTNISMYPKLWQATGLSYPKLIEELIHLAIERFQRENKIRTGYF